MWGQDLGGSRLTTEDYDISTRPTFTFVLMFSL